LIKLTSNTLKNYYGEIPYEYDLKFIHYNIDIKEDTNEEYNKLDKDLKNIKGYTKESFMIYFSDILNLIKVINNTSIITIYSNDIYLRIRNQEEYEQYSNLNLDLNLIFEINDLEKINYKNDKIIIQIDKISELPISKLNELLSKYNIQKIMVGQIAYITEQYYYLLDVMAKMYNMDNTNQLELEKNNKITNDIYSIDEYMKIYDDINKIINKYQDYDTVDKFIKIFNELSTNIYYDDKGVTETKIENQNLIGPLFNGKCVCEGYSKLLDQICSLICIDSIVVSGGGSKENGGHIWNQVCIKDKWYNADMTAQSWAIHNNEDYNLCLVSDDSLRYTCISPFKHICSYNYKKEVNK
jgi:hypothetical protein